MSFRNTRRSFLGLMAAGTAGVLQSQPINHICSARTADGAPKRILLNLSWNPANEQTVTWRTERARPKAFVQFAEGTAHPDFEKKAQTIAAEIKSFESVPGEIVGQYVARMTGLKSDTRYSYRVGDGEHWSEWIEFRTAAEQNAPFRFLYLGDAQNSIRSLCSRAMRAAFAAAPDARFLVHAGDLVAEGYDDNLWAEWFDSLGYIAATVPSMPVPGNHDMHHKPDGKAILDSPPIWRAQFSLPRNGPAGIAELDQHTYFVDYQGVRIISLDVNVYANEEFSVADKKRIGDAQAAWLEQTLRNNENRWTIVVQHQPIYTVSKDRDYRAMRELLVPLYDKYRVALVLQGHDHAYARTFPLRAGKVAAAGQGTIYAISVSGPKMYDESSNFDSLMAKQIRHTQMYQLIEVQADYLKYKAFDVEGSLLDEVCIESIHPENSK